MERRRTLPARRPGRGRAGFSLIEVVIAVLVSAMMVTAFFSVALTSKMYTNRSDHKQVAIQEAKRVLELLRTKVADTTAYQTGIIELPNDGKISGDTNSCGGYALCVGEHDVTSLLDPAFVATVDTTVPPTMKYTVTAPGSGSCFPGETTLGGYCVKVTVTWQERGS